MKQGFGIKIIGLALALAAIAIVASSCQSGVPQADVDALKKQLSDAQQQAASAQQQAASAQQQVALAPWVAKPNAPPRQPPAPLPSGVTPPPAPTPPAPQTVPIAFYVDTTTAGMGESQYNVDASMGCVRTSVFKRGMHIVWRVAMTDTSTGKVLQGSDIATAVVQIPGQQDRKLSYGRHGSTSDSPWFFSGSWDVPPDYPLGDVNYTISVTTKDGKSATWKEMRLTANNPPVYDAGLMIVQ